MEFKEGSTQDSTQSPVVGSSIFGNPIGEELISKYFSTALKTKRTFDELRLRILIALRESNRTINDLSVRSGINWRTVESHLTHLLGKKLVTEIFSSQYVRIFALTPLGQQHLADAQLRIQQSLVEREVSR